MSTTSTLPSASAAPTVHDHTVPPPGVLPTHTQTWVLAGLALLMLLVITLSGRSTPKAEPARPAGGPVTDPDQARIQAYAAQLEQRARAVLEAQARLDAPSPPAAQTAPATRTAPGRPFAAAPTSLAGETGDGPSSAARPPAAGSGVDNRQDPHGSRTDRSLFASNVALSVRAQPSTPPATSSSPSPAERARPPPTPGPSASSPPHAPTTAPQEPPRYPVLEGTLIETVLTNRLTGSFAGPVNVLVTTTVYAHDRQHLLIPSGSRILGEVRRVEALGQERLAAVFHRLVLPNGTAVTLDQADGLTPAGETGLTDEVDHHYARIVGLSIALGAIAGFAQANTSYSAVGTSAGDLYRQGVAANVSASSMQILDRYLNVLPTITIREGHRVTVYLTHDLALPAYHDDPPSAVTP